MEMLICYLEIFAATRDAESEAEELLVKVDVRPVDLEAPQWTLFS